MNKHKPFIVRFDSWLQEWLVVSSLTGQTLFHCRHKLAVEAWLDEQEDQNG